MRTMMPLRGIVSVLATTSVLPATLLVTTAAATPAQTRKASPQASAAKSYIDGIYREYERTGKRPEQRKVFTPELMSLVDKDGDIATKQGEANLIDYGLLCNCNDDGGLRYSTSIASASASASATASVTVIHVITNYQERPSKSPPFNLQLTKTPVGWRVSDIITTGKFGGSLVARLRKGLGEVAAARPEQSRGATATALPAGLPSSVRYIGYTGSERFPVFNDFTVTSSSGTLGGSGFMQIGIFSGAATLTGTYANGECSVIRKKQTWRGPCDGNEFSGFIYDPRGKQGEAFRFRTEAYLARLKAGQGSAPVAMAAVDAPPARRAVWSLGRARFLVEPRGGCPPEIALGTRSYCFTRAIDWLRRHPDKQDVDVVAMETAWLPGSLVPHNNGQGWDIYRVARQGDTFIASTQRHYATQVRVPQGCIFQDVAQRGWYIGLDRQGKVAIEAESYVCANGWSGPPIYAANLNTQEIDAAAGEIQFAGSASTGSGSVTTTARARVGDNNQWTDYGGPPQLSQSLLDRCPSCNISGEPTIGATEAEPKTKPKPKRKR